MERKRYQFCLNTFKNCFLCSEKISSEAVNNLDTVKKFSLKNIFQYLKINLTHIQSPTKKPLSILNKTEVRVSLCSDCGVIVARFAKQYRDLEICKMKVKSSLKDIFAKLKSKESFETEDEQALKHFKIVKELRQMFVAKSQLKINSSLPRVFISKRCEVPEQKYNFNYDNLASVNSLKSSVKPSTSGIDSFVETVKEEITDEGPDDDWLPEDEEFPPTDTKPEVDPLKCKVCLKTSLSYAGFRKHTLRHISQKNKCDICKKAFHLKGDLTRHRFTHDRSKLPYQCPHCSKCFIRKYELINHVAQIHKKKISLSEIICLREFKCPHCPKTYSFNDELAHHMKIHNKSFKCPKCPSRFNLRDSFIKHVKNHATPLRKSYRCRDPECEAKFPSEAQLKIHESSHLQSRKLLLERFISALPEDHGLERELANLFQCPHCPSTFTTLLDFQDHLQSTHEDKIRPGSSNFIECNICGKRVKTQIALARHAWDHRTAAEGHFECQICKRQLETFRKLRMHLRKHEACPDWNGKEKKLSKENEKQACSVCNRKFTAQAMEVHMRTHTREKLICQLCPKQFKCIRGLRGHLKIHSRLDEQFLCGICNHFFKTEAKLERHKKDRHPDPGFKPTCAQCGKVFVSEKNRLIHEREVHSGEKPHQCDACPKAFSRQNLLRNHQQRVHQIT